MYLSQASKIEYHTDDSDDGHDDEDDFENGGEEGEGITVVEGMRHAVLITVIL